MANRDVKTEKILQLLAESRCREVKEIMANRERATKKILQRLAETRWRELRRAHNREFMSRGPGDEWERFKDSEYYRRECEEIMLLRDYLGLPPES